MKQSYNGSMSELCESRLKPCPGEREPVLRKLYIDLCNLIVESRIPGIDDRGYGEGIHCPPLLGPNTHCCDLSIPECQKHQKLIHRLLRSMKRNIFDVEVFMLPDCCRETKLAERIPKKEYVLLEQWSFNCFHGKLQSSIDVPQLLRAVRSFLYFSQISAWLSANEGKSPSNIYYWVRPSSEVSTAKFENEPELHRFPICKIYEGLYGTIEVRYRTRTQYMPIIPCSKHPPQENPLITVIDNSDVCQTICLGSHIVKQLHKTCDTLHESPISDKTVTEPLSNVLMPANVPQVPVVKAIGGDVPDNISKGKGILKHSNCQIYSESVFGLAPKLHLNVDSDKNVRKSIKPLNSILDEDIIIRHSSSKNLSQKHNLTLPLKGEIKQRKLSRELVDSSSNDADFSSLDSLPSSTSKSKRKRHSSKALITNSKLSLISSSTNKVLQHSSPVRLEDGNDSSTSFHATSSDAINTNNLNKMKSCHFNKQGTSPSKVSVAVDFQKKSIELSLGSKNSLNLSQHSLRMCLENNWDDKQFSPISSKIIVSKCEPLLPQESSVPNRVKKSCRGIKRKASKCVQNSKYVCNCNNSTRKDDATFEKDIAAHLDSESNVSHNLMKSNDNDKILCSKLELHAKSRKKNFKHKRIKTESKAFSSNTASVNSTHAKNSLEYALDSSKSNSDSKNYSSKMISVCSLGTEKKHSAYNKNCLCSEDVQSKSLNSFSIGTVGNSERRIFRKRKLNEKNYSHAKPDGEVSDKKTLFIVDEAKLLSSRSSGSNTPSNLKNQRGNTHNCRRKKTLKLSARAESKSCCRCSVANSNLILDQNIECCNEKRATESTKLYEAELTNYSILNTSQSSKTDLDGSCISNPNALVDVSTATGKSFKNNIQIGKNCDFNTSKTKVQLASKSASETEKNTYPSASNELICDYALKHDGLLKSYAKANLYSEREVDCFAVRKLNRNEDSFATKLKKGRRLLLNFEESILAGCLDPVKAVIGYKVEIGASGSFCPDHLTLPADVSFYELKSSHQHTVPYMAHVTFENIEYYLPKKGSMQVTLFNPSETVVKMFVLNYDLSNMPPLHHTFIRQKTYYMPVDVAEKDPKWLRYIIHLRFASSKTGRIFLHKDFKIVVLNRNNDDAACDHIQQPCELRSFLSVPKNPAFSSL